jgi:pimeloyl-ACP methyl ester carboxylesterase
MAVDEDLLQRHRRYRDPRAGIEEEFLQPTLGDGKTVAVLARPLERTQRVGWVICHSFGMEQIYLGRLEVGIARAVAAAGFPVLRFHGHGYGDSQGGMEVASLSSHLSEARDAVELLAGRDGLDRVGVIGARFGGLVAALLADRESLPLLAAVDPVTNGSQFMRDFLRTQVFSEMVGASENGNASGMQKLRRQLTDRGWADVKGFLLSRRAYEEISSATLRTELRSFDGSALVLSVSRSGRPGPGVQELSSRLRELGASCEMAVVEHRLAGGFGQHHHRNDAGARKTDTQFEVYQAVTRRVAEWARGFARPRGGQGSPA